MSGIFGGDASPREEMSDSGTVSDRAGIRTDISGDCDSGAAVEGSARDVPEVEAEGKTRDDELGPSTLD